MESNREIPPMKNNSYVRTIAEQAYGDCMEHIDEYPTYEDLSGNGDYIKSAMSVMDSEYLNVRSATVKDTLPVRNAMGQKKRIVKPVMDTEKRFGLFSCSKNFLIISKWRP